MKAFVVPRAGATTVELAQVPVPRIDDDELLVRVEAVGVGIHDSYFLPPEASYPFTAGIEAAGVVETVGSQVSGHEPGERIAFVSSMQPKGGTWAEYAAVRADALILSIPEGLDYERAAALPVAGNTILRALRGLADSSPRESLFIAGGSGAIGTLGIQIAVRQGWRVAASESSSNHEHLLALGAELAVDYRDPEWPDQVLAWRPAGLDAAIAVQPGTSAGCLPVVRDGGGLISISGDQVVADRGVRFAGIPYQADVRAELAQLMTDVAAGEVHVEIEQVYPFEDAPAALAKVQTRHARGKLVLRMG